MVNVEELMMKFTSLTDYVAQLEQKIDAQDHVTADLVTQIDAMRLLLMKIINEQTVSVDLLFDINYSILKQDIGIEQKIQLGLLMTKVAKEHAAGLPVPSVNEFHYQLLQILNVPENEKGDYSLEISKRLLSDCLK